MRPKFKAILAGAVAGALIGAFVTWYVMEEREEEGPLKPVRPLEVVKLGLAMLKVGQQTAALARRWSGLRGRES